MHPKSATPKMTADEFLRWAVERGEGEHYELLDGVVIESKRFAGANLPGPGVICD